MSVLAQAGIALRRAKANAGGWFWLPCPLCRKEFGGNEHRALSDDKRSSIPCRKSLSTGHLICPDCTDAGLGWGRNYSLAGDWLSERCHYCEERP